MHDGAVRNRRESKIMQEMEVKPIEKQKPTRVRFVNIRALDNGVTEA